MLSDLISLLFPHRCVACGRSIGEDEPELCIHCEGSLSATRYYNMKDNPVSQLFWGRTKVSNAFSGFHYKQGSVLQEAMFSLKYYGNEAVGAYLGNLLAAEVKRTSFLNDLEAVIPVPLHPIKQRKRGYNQAQLIAEGFEKAMGKPVLSDTVKRVRFTSSQTKKSTFKRSQNVDGIFRMKTTIPYRNVAILDDVITTGSTMISMIHELHKEQPELNIFPLSVGSAS